MNYNFEHVFQEYETKFEQLQKSSLSLKDQKSLITECRILLSEISSNINKYNTEINLITNNNIKKNAETSILKKYQDKHKTYNNALKDLIISFNTTKKNTETNDQIDNSIFNAKTSEQILDIGIKVNNDAIDRLRRIEKIGNTTEATAIEIHTELIKQGETINRIDENLQVMDSNIQRAKREIMWFFRQLAGNKCFVLILILLIIGVSVVIFLFVYKKKL